METERGRDAVVVEAAAAVDYIMRERLIGTKGWLVWMTMAAISVDMWSCVWCE